MAEHTIIIKEGKDPKHVQQVENYLSGLPGVIRVLTDIEDGEVKIQFEEDQLDLTDVLKKLEEDGFHLI